MLDGRQMAQWDHTAAILAMQAEINRDRKKRRKPFGPGDFHPMVQQKRKKKRPKERTKDISILWQVFCG